MAGVRRKSNGTVSIGIIVVAFLVIMGVQIVHLKQKVDAKDANYREKLEEYAAETERAQEIDAYESYMKSDQAVEDIAKAVCGLVYKNEIVYKEKSRE